ncbi:MAG: NAD-dependent malic enzyme [Polyangiaceae bacterium]|nr:NAD-dependent malic enzyme [Polyangiaceae bacterium]
MPRISSYFDIRRDKNGEPFMEVYLEGIALLRLTMTNKGTAFTPEERLSLGLDGLLPPQVNTIEQQLERVYGGFRREPSPIAKYQYLRGLQERNEILYYALLARHLEEMLPIVYTPTVGQAVQEFNYIYQNPRGLSLSPLNIDRADKSMSTFPWEDVRMIVATDSSAILGIGDQGYGGLAIPIGKLSLYTVGGGVSPFHSMPVVLDVGTDRTDLLTDSFYLGVRQRRLTGKAYEEFMDKFVQAVQNRYPRAVIQWEDLSKEAAFTVLERYRKVHPSFNDDIQGTGAVTLAGVRSACRQLGQKLTDQRVIVYGAGAGGVGVSTAILQGMMRDGLTEEQARSRIFVLDSKGLLIGSRKMEEYKRRFAHPDAEVAHLLSDGKAPGLLDTIVRAKATVLIGLSGQPHAFGEAAVRAMAKNVDRPIIFPLSNPTSLCEALPEEVLRWTDGKALVATGSPFDAVRLGGVTYPIGQGNNAFIFPGLGFGSILSDAKEITDSMVMAASEALAEYTAREHPSLIYPPVSELQEVSTAVATAVIRQAFADGVATSTKVTPETAGDYVRSKFWEPKYLHFVKG